MEIKEKEAYWEDRRASEQKRDDYETRTYRRRRKKTKASKGLKKGKIAVIIATLLLAVGIVGAQIDWFSAEESFTLSSGVEAVLVDIELFDWSDDESDITGGIKGHFIVKDAEDAEEHRIRVDTCGSVFGDHLEIVGYAYETSFQGTEVEHYIEEIINEADIIIENQDGEAGYGYDEFGDINYIVFFDIDEEQLTATERAIINNDPDLDVSMIVEYHFEEE